MYTAFATSLFGDHKEYRLTVAISRYNQPVTFVTNAKGEIVSQIDSWDADEIREQCESLPDGESPFKLPKKNKDALNLGSVVKVLAFDPDRGIKVRCLMTEQVWFADPRKVYGVY